MNILKKIIRIFWKTLIGIAAFLSLYFLFAWILSKITSNSDFETCSKDAIEIYILTNGVHTDIVVPFKSSEMDWSSIVNSEETLSRMSDPKLVSFGWGDKGFYLDTPTWADLKFKTAFNAMFFLSTTAMHVTFYNELNESKSCKKICINKDEYLKLVKYIKNSFQLNNGKTMLIKGHSYSDNDIFYDANGTYSLFNTCNTWANRSLKEAGIKACYWTPYDWEIFNKH